MVQAAKAKKTPPEKNAGKRAAPALTGILALSCGLALAGLGAFMALSFVTGDVGVDPRESAKTCWTGLLGAWMAYGGLFTFGRVPALVMSVLVFLWGVHVARTMRLAATWPQVFGGALIIAATGLGTCAFADTYDMNTGGLLAVYASPPAILYFGRWGLVVATVGVMVLGILLTFGEVAVDTVHKTIFLLRDIGSGIVSMTGRLVDLVALLLRPRVPATVAAGGGGAVMTEPAASAASAKISVPEPVERTGAPASVAERAEKAEKTGKEWKPRQAFQSRFLAVDPGNAVPTDPVEPADEALGSILAAASASSGILVDSEAFLPEENVDGTPEAKTPEPLPSRPSLAAMAAAAAERAPQPSVAKPTPQPAPKAVEKPALKPDPAPKAAAPAKPSLEGYTLPPLEILDPPEPPVMEDAGLIEAKAKILEQTLAEFKIEGRVVHIERGPRVTMYELSLAPGIRLNKVTSLADNIAMQLQAESVRIIAPIPGKNTIGIEIPNTCKELVSLREIVGAVNREKRRQALPVCLGKDVSGQALVADLARMPHLLIAGATGSGKSVCINSIIMSVMMCCRPDETQLIMVDPKVVELSRFKDIPHLMSPVITDMKRAVSVLDWICQKMDERYEQMSQVSVNNIAKFNALGDEGIRERLDEFASLEDIEAFPKKMPYMVVIIDELADLMMVAGKEVEQHITRLAAKSRAVGIHLILATQRPSVDVITGLIKANMPCRIAFQVSSRVDSRTILDGNGAETLLGQGDMLYLPPGVGKLTRAQGVFVSDEELFRVVDYAKSLAAPQYHEDLLGPVIGGNAGAVDVSKFDELFLESGEAIIENQRGSVSLLQRKFGIGYGRASRIIDQLASVGLLGPFRDGKAREILLSVEEFRAKFGGGGSGGAPWDDDDDGDGGLAGLRDDERERPQADWDDENED